MSRFGFLIQALVISMVLQESPAADLHLWNVSAGQLPNDTALENKSSFQFLPARKPNSARVRIRLAAGDSCGMNLGNEFQNWSNYRLLRFSARNLLKTPGKLELTIRHGQSSGYGSRIDVPLVIRSEEQIVQINLAKLRNNDGTPPAWKTVRHWYFANPSNRVQNFELTDVLLVDHLPEKSGNPGSVRIDPARLKRIRSAKLPLFDEPVTFDSKLADQILASLEVFPPDHPMNQLVDEWPLHPDSSRIIQGIGAEKPLRYNADMSFCIVPSDQPRVPVRITAYSGESDPGPFPIPDSIPLEGWPIQFEPDVALGTVQSDMRRFDGDRHAIVVDPVARRLYEFFRFRRGSRGWEADQASEFDLASNRLRPQGWTSADAAGLPIFPAVVRYDELKRGVIDHAMRVTIRRTRRAFVAPATHFASRSNDPGLPRMGERIRLRRDFNLTGFSPPVRTILTGLKRYGMLVADNGIDWAISVAPDPRIPKLHEELRRVRGRDLEIVVSPSQTETED